MDKRFATAGVAALSAESLSAEQAIGDNYRFFDVPGNGTYTGADSKSHRLAYKNVINFKRLLSNSKKYEIYYNVYINFMYVIVCLSMVWTTST